MLTERLARGLRRERRRLRWTQEHAADVAGVNVRHYRKLEAGEVNVTLRTVEQLCEAFDVDVRQLFPHA